jgi:hypothetical protein
MARATSALDARSTCSSPAAVTIVTASGDRHLPLSSKDEIAAGILDAVMDLRGAKDSRSNGVTGIAE